MKNIIEIVIRALKPFIQKYGKYLWKIIWFFLSPLFNKLVKKLSDWISRKTEEKQKSEPQNVTKSVPVTVAANKKCHSTKRRKLIKQRRKANHQNKKA